MSILCDFHMHSSFSTDSDAPLEEMVRATIERGLTRICVTEHMDADYPVAPGDFEADPAAVWQEVTRLRGLYGDQIEIGFGMELGMQPHLRERFGALAAAWPFDFLIASQHLTGPQDPYYPEVWEGRTTEDVIGQYLHEMYDNLAHHIPEWDTLGHLDYIIRYIPGRAAGPGSSTPGSNAPKASVTHTAAPYDIRAAFPKETDEILKLVIETGKCLEVNTAGFKYGLGQPHPSPALLRRYRALGGTRITIGSDAHAPQHVACGYEEAAKLLKELGFKSCFVFRSREPEEIGI